jgi:hypothetical protein
VLRQFTLAALAEKVVSVFAFDEDTSFCSVECHDPRQGERIVMHSEKDFQRVKVALVSLHSALADTLHLGRRLPRDTNGPKSRCS